jgi:class 3 adenylate cyclase
MKGVVQKLYSHPVWFLGLTCFSIIIIVTWNILSLTSRINSSVAEQYAAEHIQTLNIVHSMYSSEVVKRVKPHGTKIDPNYLQTEGAIPPPATFSILLAERINQHSKEGQTRLFSDYPWPNRVNGGVHDEFERQALDNLAKNPDKPYSQVVSDDYGTRFHYATAILMKQGCVDCHNAHSDSPKTDWKVGDFRGARKIVIPLKSAMAVIQDGLLETVILMFGGAALLMVLIGFILRDLRRSSLLIEEKNIDLEATNISLTRFVPNELFAFLGKDRIVDVQLGDRVEKEMSIIFSDIRDFATLSERLSPEDSFQFINSYLASMGPIVRENGGFIDKYIGDAIMAIFVSPDDAVRSSIAMLRKLEVDNNERLKQGEKAIAIGVGINTGHLLLGAIGEESRIEGTVISDAVNLASRIETLTKEFGTLLITESTYRRLKDPSRYLIRLVDSVIVKGKTVPVAVYEVFDTDSAIKQREKEENKERVQEGIKLYHHDDFQQAYELFQAIKQTSEHDRLIDIYLARCQGKIRLEKD